MSLARPSGAPVLTVKLPSIYSVSALGLARWPRPGLPINIKWTERRIQAASAEHKNAIIIIVTNDCSDSLTAAVSWAAVASKVCSRAPPQISNQVNQYEVHVNY